MGTHFQILNTRDFVRFSSGAEDLPPRQAEVRQITIEVLKGTSGASDAYSAAELVKAAGARSSVFSLSVFYPTALGCGVNTEWLG